MRIEPLQVVACAAVFAALGMPAVMAETNPPQRHALAVVVHELSSVNNLTKAELRKLLLGEINRWPDRRQVVLVERDTDSQAYRQMLEMVLRMTPLDYKRHLVAVEFQGSQPPLIKTLNSDDGAIQFVRSVPGAIALVDTVPTPKIAWRVKTLRIDGKLPGEAGYPLQ